MVDDKYPKYFSYSYKLNLDSVPTKKTDRASLWLLLPGIFLGFLLVVMGGYELLDGFNSSKTAFDGLDVGDKVYNSTILSPVVFDLVVISIGIGIVMALISFYIRYQKIFFDGSTLILTNRPLFGAKKIISESLISYEGVRYRIEFFQFGFWNRNKYIIELCHEDESKTVPLYINTNNKDISKIIKFYAEKLGKPIIISRGGDFVYRTVSEYGKSIIDIKGDVDGYDLDMGDYSPRKLSVVNKNDKKIIKVKKVLFDAYNVIFGFFILLLSMLLVVLSQRSSENALLSDIAYASISICICLSLFAIFRRDKIIIKKEKIIVHHKFLGISRKHSEVMKKDVKSIEVATNPATGRSFLVLATENREMVFGKKVPIDDLYWVRSILIKDILEAK